MTFAFQDAGVVPYYSEMKNIDLVGLNTSVIAKSKTVLEAYNVLDSMKPTNYLYRFNIIITLECRTFFQDVIGLCIQRAYPDANPSTANEPIFLHRTNYLSWL